MWTRVNFWSAHLKPHNDLFFRSLRLLRARNVGYLDSYVGTFFHNVMFFLRWRTCSPRGKRLLTIVFPHVTISRMKNISKNKKIKLVMCLALNAPDCKFAGNFDVLGPKLIERLGEGAKEFKGDFGDRFQPTTELIVKCLEAEKNEHSVCLMEFVLAGGLGAEFAKCFKSLITGLDPNFDNYLNDLKPELSDHLNGPRPELVECVRCLESGFERFTDLKPEFVERFNMRVLRDICGKVHVVFMGLEYGEDVLHCENVRNLLIKERGVAQGNKYDAFLLEAQEEPVVSDFQSALSIRSYRFLYCPIINGDLSNSTPEFCISGNKDLQRFFPVEPLCLFDCGKGLRRFFDKSGEKLYYCRSRGSAN